MSIPEIYTPSEVATMFKCSVSAVRALLETGRLQSVQISIGKKKHRRITSAHIQAYLTGQPAEPQIKKPKPELPPFRTTRHLRLKQS